jgi:phospholipase C
MSRKAQFGLHASFAAFLLLAVNVGCGGSSNVPSPTPTINPALHYPQHVVVVVMENRSVDNLFHFLPGVDTVSSGRTHDGHIVPLLPVSLFAAYDPDHSHSTGFVKEFANGSQDGFDLETSGCLSPPPNKPYRCYQNVYAYVPQQEVQPYYQLAETNAFADEVLQTNSGPSYPAHEYLVAGQSGRPTAIAENPGPNIVGGCGNTTPGESVMAINLNLPFPSHEEPVFPCVDFPTIFDSLNAHHISWKYYLPTTNTLWNAMDQIKHIYDSKADQARVVAPEEAIFHDISRGALPAVSYVIPHGAWSDHPTSICLNLPIGTDFVGALVDAVGTSPYWNSTTVIVVWDDWGGWYDHARVRPPLGLPNDPYEYGFRVPLLVISPYAKPHYVDATPRDFTAILHFIEDVRGLPPISSDSVEQRTDDLFSMFQFGASTPRPFQPVSTAHGPSYWAALPSPLPKCIQPTPLPTPPGGIPSSSPGVQWNAGDND